MVYTVKQKLVLGSTLTTHKKTPCPFCPQKFNSAASRNKHIDMKHNNRRNRKLNCRLAPACEEMFNSLKELGIHSRQVHKAAFPFRCNYKNYFDCFRTVDGLVKHSKTHGKESWDCEAPEVFNGCSAWRALGTAKTVTRVP